MYTSLSYIICIARVFDDHRSCQKLINYITNIKAKSKRYHWIQKIPVFIIKKKKNEKEELSPSLQVVFSIVDRFQFEI